MQPHIFCFNCMKEIRSKKYTVMRVRKDFCHSSYWDKQGKQYGHLEDNNEFGILYLHSRCTANENEWPTVYGEGYEYCEGCNTVFNNESMSYEIYEKSGNVLCPHCARDYVLEHLNEFLQEGLPDFTGQLPSINLDALSLKHPKLREAPEDIQGWCSSIAPHYTRDIGHGTYEDAIKAIVERGNKWLIIIGGPGVTHNVCSIAVTVYEYEHKTPFNVPILERV